MSQLSHRSVELRIPDTYEAKIAKTCNFSTFWPVIRLITHLFKIQKNSTPGLKGIFVYYSVLAELQARMSRSCRFLPHKYQVSLSLLLLIT